MWVCIYVYMHIHREIKYLYTETYTCLDMKARSNEAISSLWLASAK